MWPKRLHCGLGIRARTCWRDVCNRHLALIIETNRCGNQFHRFIREPPTQLPILARSQEQECELSDSHVLQFTRYDTEYYPTFKFAWFYDRRYWATVNINRDSLSPHLYFHIILSFPLELMNQSTNFHTT